MSFQGKQLSADILEAIVRLKKHFDEERKAGDIVSTKDAAKRTANALGVGVATVRRTMADYKRSGEKVVVHIKNRPGRPASSIPQNVQPIVRGFIRSENLNGQRVTINKVLKHLKTEYQIDVPKMNLWRALKRWGFTHGEGRRRDSLKEQTRVILARREYLRAKLANRNSDGSLKRPEVYLDETYINKNHSSRFTWYLDEDGPDVNKPAGVGPRLIIVDAITKDGWVGGAQLVFEAKKRTGDYHGQMNWDNFSKWFESQLMENIPSGSLIILDNARYHNVYVEEHFPNNNASRDQLKDWLTRNAYPWREDMLKSELLELCKRLSPAPEYRLDKIAAKKGHTILRSPPYHPELQPIETCWAVVKNYMATNCDFTMAGLRAKLPIGFNQVTTTTCAEIMEKVIENELNYWKEDEKLDSIYSEDAEEESIGASLFGRPGLEFCLEDL